MVIITKESELKVKIPTKEESRRMYGNVQVSFEDLPQKNLMNLKKFYSKYWRNDLKLSPLVKIFKKGDNIALFHPFTMKKVYGNKKFYEFIKNIKKNHRKNLALTKKLFELGFLADSSFSKEKFIKNFRKRFSTIPNMWFMYIIMTDKCNFSCKYCFIESALNKKNRMKMMSYKTAKKGIDFFCQQIKSKGPKQIIFYGGEPLLNFDVMKKTIAYIRKKEGEKSFNGPVNINLITNGSLITTGIAKFLKYYNVRVCISIDGPKKIHDKMRIYENQSSTFSDAMNGYRILKEMGFNLSISCTIGKHNVKNLDEIVEFFANLKANSIGFNILKLTNEQKYMKVSIRTVTKKLIKACEKCRKFGISEDRIFNRRIIPFVEEVWWYSDCAGCGDQIVLLPNGKIGTCQPFLNTLKYYQNIPEKTKLSQNKIWLQWKKRAPIFMEKCIDCAAISICGGGCPYQAFQDKGSIWEKDERMCIFVNKVLEWMIWDLFKKLN